MKRKFLIVLISALLALALFTACDLSEGDPNSTTASETTAETTAPPMQEEKIYITANLHNETKIVYPNEAGEYTLDLPSRAGFEFVCWKTANGDNFAASGSISENVTVTAEWRLLETSTFAQLKERIEAGAETILLTDDIVLTESIYVVSKTEITAKNPVTLKRSADFLGDLFVIGETPNAENVIVLTGNTASLSLKPNNTSLVIDGESISANGTAFLLLNSSDLNIYDGVYVQNHVKLGNERLSAERDYNISYPEKVGGAAAIISSGSLNMYGGVISNCSANEVDDDDISTCGGAIYNFGNFHMYGGVIENNRAARGAAIYNYRTAKIYAGTLKNNYASTYGGVMYMPNSQYTYCVLGSDGSGSDVMMSNNYAKKSGGAIFASHQSAIDILGNTVFDSNISDANGGAINAAGSLTINYAAFINNQANGASSKGGAIYAYHGDEDYSTRIINIKSGIFSNNSAPRGAAIGFSGNDDVDPPKGAIGYIGNVYFINNSAYKNNKGKYGNGGAIWAAISSTVEISSEAFFLNNFAEDGATSDICTTSEATVTIEGLEASGNS